MFLFHTFLSRLYTSSCGLAVTRLVPFYLDILLFVLSPKRLLPDLIMSNTKGVLEESAIAYPTLVRVHNFLVGSVWHVSIYQS